MTVFALDKHDAIAHLPLPPGADVVKFDSGLRRIYAACSSGNSIPRRLSILQTGLGLKKLRLRGHGVGRIFTEPTLPITTDQKWDVPLTVNDATPDNAPMRRALINLMYACEGCVYARLRWNLEFINSFLAVLELYQWAGYQEWG